MTPEVFAQPVHLRVRARTNWLVANEALKVIAESLDGRVTLGRFFLEGLGENRVEILAQAAMKFFRRRAASLRRCGSALQSHLRSGRRVNFRDGLQKIRGRMRACSGWMSAGEQHVEQNSERIDV